MTSYEKNFQEIHYIAEQFLRDHGAVQADTLMSQSIERGMPQVILVRTNSPEYFCGFKRGNTKVAVWSHDIRFAKSIDVAQMDLWHDAILKLGEIALPIWNGVSPGELE
jgi:hypothetical protein